MTILNQTFHAAASDLLLVVDAGNTNTKFGVYQDETLLHHWSFETERVKQGGRLLEDLQEIVSQKGFHPRQLAGIAMSSVVPKATPQIVSACRKLFGQEPMLAAPSLRGWLPSDIENPEATGSDRMVQSFAATQLFGGPLIVVGLGTATTFCVIDRNGRYKGGLILPGIQVAADAMAQSASRLPNRVDIIRPDKVVAQNTLSGMQSGVFFGAVGQVDGVVQRIRDEYQLPFTVVATGGFAELIATESQTIQYVRPRLLLEGLRMLWEQNRPVAVG